MKPHSKILILVAAILTAAFVAGADDFKVGVAKTDISPAKPVPMWGYGARHDILSQGVRDTLYAKALVIQAGSEKLALVGLDLGRSPTEPMMANIRAAIAAAGIKHLMIVGSHTHHGPVIELKDEPGKGKGRFDDAIAYTAELEKKIIDTILQAAANPQDAKMGWASEEVPWNHNRHTKREPKPVDREFAVLRFDDLSGKPLAVLVNFAAHPTNLDEADFRFSSEYPGQMMNTVEAAMGCACLFMQGAAGDLSTDRGELNSIEAYGKALGEKAAAIAGAITTTVPEQPQILSYDEDFSYASRIDLANPLIQYMFQQAFFPELTAVLDEFPNNTIKAHLTTVLLNRQLAFVGGSGEFFCSHGIRLKQRCHGVKPLFFGYCNGHQMYFPTIEATAEGGYGADATVSWVALGAGEQMIDKALINIYTLLGKYQDMAAYGLQ